MVLSRTRGAGCEATIEAIKNSLLPKSVQQQGNGTDESVWVRRRSHEASATLSTGFDVRLTAE